MKSYKVLWYTVQKKSGEYWMGKALSHDEVDESEVIEGIKEYCDRKSYRLVVLIHVVPDLPIVNQIYPYVITEETQNVIGQLVEAALTN